MERKETIHAYLDGVFYRTFNSTREINEAKDELGKVAISRSEPLNDERTEFNLYFVTVNET